MSTTFWGRSMAPGESYPITCKGILQLKQICLSQNPKDGKTTLKVKAKGHTFVLCSLIKDEVECQTLSHFFIAEDDATLILTGQNSVDLIGVLEEDGDDTSEAEEEEEDSDYEMRETITGEPRNPSYLSDLLGPDLPDSDDDDYEEELNQDQDDYGTLAFRDPTDNSFIGGFELRHFNLAPDVDGYEKVDLRKEEADLEDTLLNDNIAKGLVNSLINSGDNFQMKQGQKFLKVLKKQCSERKEKK